mmetsp:Transcript_47305/g.102723  ORF Transcript_47305/g.102723 Transcript_47305/m.102723 type:complete len:217 (-) Transcript_47305:471-1121(-)
MLVNILYLHRRHGWLDIVGALCLVVGLCIFTLGDSTISPEWDPLGIPMVSVALLADALIGNVQEKVMRENGATQDEMVLYSHGVGAIYLFIVCFLNDQLTGGVIVCFKSPHVLFLILAFSVSGYFGVSFVMTLVGRFGAVIAVTVTSCRKALTIFLSFVFFPKPFSATYGVAVTVFFTGVALSTLEKNPALQEALINAWRRLRNGRPSSPRDTELV